MKEDWKEGLIIQQKELKEKLAKLVEFINSEKFYELSPNNRLLLKNQKIAMELYLNILNMRVFEEVDKIVVPDYGMMQLMGSVLGSTWGKPFTQFPDSAKPVEQFDNMPLAPDGWNKTTGVDKTPRVE